MAQTVKHLSAKQETWVRSLGWEDPQEKEMAAHSSILALQHCSQQYINMASLVAQTVKRLSAMQETQV